MLLILSPIFNTLGYATAQHKNITLINGDQHPKDLPGVETI